MTKSKNKHSTGVLVQAFSAAKKLSRELQKPQVVATTSAAEQAQGSNIIDGKARFKHLLDVDTYENPQQMLRQHLPKLSHQVLGRHYGKANQLAAMVSPDLGDKISEHLFQWLNNFSSNSSLTEKILEEAGVTDIAELTRDTARSQRLSQALIEQNKILAAAQGLATGVAGVWGATVDIPASIVLVLRTIYQTGRSHGFDLSQEQDQEVVAFIFQEIDLGLLAEKHALLLALKAMQSTLATHDLQQFQQLLGSGNDIELAKKWLLNDEGQLKWGWLNHLPQLSVLGKLTPIVGAAVGGFYSWKLLQDVGQKSQAVFGAARFYMNEHPSENMSPLAAYYQAEVLLQKTGTHTLQVQAEVRHASSTQQNHNAVISHVAVQMKDHAAPTTVAAVDDKIEQGLQKLATQHVAEHEHSEQQAALKAADDELAVIDELDLQIEQKPFDIEPTSKKRS